MAVDVIIDPSSGQIYWNDAAGSGTQTIAISGNATNAINIVGYSNFFSPGGGGVGTQILATFNDSATATLVPGTSAFDLGSSALRWNFYGTAGNFTGVISTSSSTASTSTTTGALVVTGGVGIGGSLWTGTSTLSSISGVQFYNSRAQNGFTINTTGSYSFNIQDGANNQRLNYHGDSNRTEFTGNVASHEIRFFNSNQSSYTGFKANSTGTVTYTWPAGDGTANQVLYTNGSAALGWTTPSGSAAGSSTQIQYNQGGAFGATNQLTYVPSTGILSTPNLTLTYQAANEGGEIVFSQPSSGTALTTTITVDIYQNKLRFFETGGANRGAYIDFTACGNGVATNLLVGSGASGLTSLNGLTSSTQTFATGTSGTDFNISSATSTHTFNIPYAGSGATGLITTQTQTIAGAKTFSSALSVSASTVSTSTTTGALIITGGVGIAGSIWSGQHIVTDTTTSTTTATGAMLIFGGLGVSGQINSASLVTSGNAVISGNLQFNGNGTWGNATTDTITSLARYASDLLPSADNTYDLGNNSLGWKNFRVSGVGTVGGLTFSSGVVTAGVWSGTAVSVANGGTGQATFTANSVLLGNGTSAIASTSGSSAQVLVWQASGAPTFVTLSGDLSITAAGVVTIASNSVALGTDTTGQYASTIAISGSGITATTAAGDDGTAYTIYSSAVSTNTASSIVLRDGSGNFSAGTITAALTGTASIASSSVASATITDTSSTLYLLGSRSSTGFAGTAIYVDSNISFSGSTITASLTGTASTATNSANINVVLDTTSTIYLTGSRSNSSIGSTPAYVLSGVSALGNTLTATTFVGALTGTASIATSSVSSATITDTSSTLYLLGSRSSTGFAGTSLYVDSNISISGFQITGGVWAATAVSAVNGGTGQVSYTIGDILYASSTTALSKLSAGTAGSVLASGGAGAAPYWKIDSTGGGGGTPAGSTSWIQYNNGGSFGATSHLAYGGNGNNDFVISAPYSGATQGQVNIGMGVTAFDGLTLGKFAGSASGTIIAVNYASGFTGNFADFQLAGSSKFTVGYDGKVSVVGVFSLPTTAGTAGSVLTSNGTGNQLYWSAPGTGGGGSGTVTSGTAGSIAYYTGSGTTVGGAPGFTYTTSGTASTINVFGGGAIGTTIFTVQAYSATSVRVGIGTNLPQYELEIVGEISATNKSFVIDHPTKSGKKLRYGSLEGPENGVYVRGELKDSNIIVTPDHWLGLVHPDTFTVTLTPIGRFSQLYVEKIEDYKVFIADAYMNPIHCFYTVWAERKDIPKLITEY